MGDSLGLNFNDTVEDEEGANEVHWADIFRELKTFLKGQKDKEFWNVFVTNAINFH